MYLSIGIGLYLPKRGAGGGPPPYDPSLVFSDDRNSQYVPVVFS